MVPVVFIGVNRNLQYHLSGSRWTLFGKLLMDIERDLYLIQPNLMNLRIKIQEINQLLKIPSFRQLEGLIKQNVMKQTGMSEVDIRFSEPNILIIIKTLN